MPPAYPAAEPLEVRVRSPALGRAALKELSDAARRAAAEASRAGEPAVLCVYQAVEEGVRRALDEAAARGEADEAGDDAKAEGNTRERLKRVYVKFHHLFSSAKRRGLLQGAQGAGLSGFSMPGKPGVLVAEGESAAVDSFMAEIRRWSWQRMTLRREDAPDSRAFGGQFVELVIPAGSTGVCTQTASGGAGRGSMSKSDKRPELGLLQQHLEAHGVGDAFRDLVGL